MKMGIFESEHAQGKHHGWSGTGRIKGKAGEEQGSEGAQPCWAQPATGMALIPSFNLLALSRADKGDRAKISVC